MLSAQTALVAELGAIVRSAKARNDADDVAMKVSQLLASKATLADMLSARISAIERMVEASKKPASDAVISELAELAAKRAPLLPTPKAAKKAEKKVEKAAIKECLPAASTIIAESNPLPWPETEALPLEVIEVCGTYIDMLLEGTATAKELGASRDAAVDLMHGARVTATVKLDGTNVGKEAEGGDLVGRRLRIDESLREYQRTSLDALRPIDAARFKRVLLESMPLACTSGINRVTVYGELVCHDLYDYRAAGLVAGWRAFGAVLGTTHDAAHETAEALVQSGWAAKASGMNHVRLSACPRLLDAMNRSDLPTVEAVAVDTPGGVCALVDSASPFMLAQKGEGLVVTLQRPNRPLTVRKWKISAEHQPRCVNGLKRLSAKLDSLSAAQSAHLPAKVAETVAKLLAVATAPLTDTFKASTGAAFANKYLHAKDSKEPALSKASANKAANNERAQAADVALRSALTKYDSPEAMFAAGSMPAGVADMLMEEMRVDLAGGDKEATRIAETRVRRYVGQVYAKWKARDTAEVATGA